MPLQKVRQASQYDAPHHAIGQRISKGSRRGKGFDARVTVALVGSQSPAGQFSHGRRHAVDDRRGILVDQVQKGRATFRDAPQGFVADRDRLPPPGDAVDGFQIDVGPSRHDYSHGGAFSFLRRRLPLREPLLPLREKVAP